MLTRRTLLAAAALLPMLAAGAPALADDAPLPVVASFSILGDIAREIGGDHVAVKTLVGPNGDAHVYEPTPADAKAVGAAKVLIVNGLDFESWLPRLTKSSGFKGMEVVASNGIAPRRFAADDDDGHHHDHDHDHDHDDAAQKATGAKQAHAEADDDHDEGHDHHHHHGDIDPHAWQDLANGVIYARNIAAALEKADPANGETYRRNAEAYVSTLQALDARLKKQFAAIPEAERRVVTSHDAFGYFGRAYGISFIAPVGMSTEAEPSAADIARIIDQIKRDNIRAVFVENITNTRLIDQIVRETGAKVGGNLYSDALSDEDGPAPTYVKMFEYNASELLKALPGS
ncbi:metal ABC transporter substrate-binding protein [Rhodoligotrophos defluvii]|uniref:metal ABC transporter substrate-binding protein n=1 Tax=Rhodoligotrophos defluvii TaxID=2561934 RepID=UPI0010CA0372|nr:metal ABC transporter substrate-binding protein [Rhodoligotrophos defluvii]